MAATARTSCSPTQETTWTCGEPSARPARPARPACHALPLFCSGARSGENPRKHVIPVASKHECHAPGEGGLKPFSACPAILLAGSLPTAATTAEWTPGWLVAGAPC